MDKADLPALQRAAAHVAALHAAAAGPVADGAGPAAGGAQAAAGAAAAEHRGCDELPPPPPRWLPAAVVDAGGAPAADIARAVDTLADLLTVGDQVHFRQLNPFSALR